MHKINTMSLHTPDRVKDNWDLAEVWIDAILSPPYILLLLGDRNGNCSIYDPAEGYKVIFTSSSYKEAQLWLLEDEYDLVEGRIWCL